MKKLNILLALGSFFPENCAGTETYVLGLAKYLRNQGHSVDIVIPHSENDLYEYEGFKVYKYKISNLPSAEELCGKIPPTGLNEFISILDKLKPDLIHFHSYNRAMNFWHLKAAKERGIKTVFTVHVAGLFCVRSDLLYKRRAVCDGKVRLHRCMACYIQQKINYRVLSEILAVGVNLTNALFPWIRNIRPFFNAVRKKKEELLMIDKYSDKIISIAKWMVEAYRINGVENVVPIAHEISFLPTTNYSKSTNGMKCVNKIKLIFAGRLYPIKNVEILLDALTSIDYSKFNLIMAVIPDKNSPEYYNKIKNKYASLGFKDWYENLSSEEALNLIAESDLLCLPSKSEVAPIVIKEAFNSGTPVLGSDIPAIKEMVTDGRNGLLFKQNDINSLKNILISMNSNTINELKKGVAPMSNIILVYGEVEKIYNSISTNDETT